MRRSALVMVMAMMNGLVAACASAPTAAGTSGIQGTVVIAPAHAGPQRAGDADSPPCACAPVRLLTMQGRLVSQVIADAQGQFKVVAPAGQYQVEVGPPDAPYPRCDSVEVAVREGSPAQVQVHCDSGMR